MNTSKESVIAHNAALTRPLRILLLISFFVATDIVFAATLIRVAPAGDSNATLDELLKDPAHTASIEQAFAILGRRELRDQNGAPLDDIVVQLAAGVYRLRHPLHLDQSTTGSATHPIVIQGPRYGAAVISGSLPVDQFTAIQDQRVLSQLRPEARTHVLQASLEALGVRVSSDPHHGWGAMNIPAPIEVFYRGKRMPLARWPNVGFARIASTPGGSARNTFTVEGVDAGKWRLERHLVAEGYWFNDWSDTTAAVALNADTGVFSLTQRVPYGIKRGQRIFFENVLAELDEPGEWYADADAGILYFWPPRAVQAGDVEVSVSDKLIASSRASFTSFKHITFEQARGDAMSIEGGSDIRVEDSVIRNVGNRGAVLRGTRHGIANSLVEDTGEGGVVLIGGDRQSLAPGNLYVEQSTIRRFARLSRTYQPAISISGVGNRAIGNRISDAPSMALLFSGNDHLVAKNEISQVCLETGDCGAVYAGADWTGRGTVLANNHVHDIPPNIELGTTKAVYLDDQACGTTIRENTIENVQEGVFLGGGRDNIIEDNTFVKVATPIHLDARGIGWQKSETQSPSGRFRRSLELVPYNRAPYLQKYPHLAAILNDDPGLPKYNISRGNQFVECGNIRITKDAEGGISLDAPR